MTVVCLPPPIPVAHIKRLLNHGTNYTSNRRPSFYNTLVHRLAKEINEGKVTIPYVVWCQTHLNVTDREPGDRIHLHEIKHCANEEMVKHDFSKEEEEELINELTEFRKMQQKGACGSNKATALDLQATVANIAGEVSTVYTR